MIRHLRPRAAQISLKQTTFFAARAQTEPPNGSSDAGRQRGRDPGAAALLCGLARSSSAPLRSAQRPVRAGRAAAPRLWRRRGSRAPGSGAGRLRALWGCAVLCPPLVAASRRPGRRSCRVPRAVRSCVLRVQLGAERCFAPCLSAARCLRDPALLPAALLSDRTDGLGGNVRHVWYRLCLLKLASVVWLTEREKKVEFGFCFAL